MGASKKGQRTKNVVRKSSLKAKAKGKKGSLRSNKKKGKRRTYKKVGGIKRNEESECTEEGTICTKSFGEVIRVGICEKPLSNKQTLQCMIRDERN